MNQSMTHEQVTNYLESRDMLLKWPEKNCEGACCHAVISMITHRPISEIVELSKQLGLGIGGVSQNKLYLLCKEVGIQIGEWQDWTGNDECFPLRCLIMTYQPEGWHIVFKNHDKYYDPNYKNQHISRDLVCVFQFAEVSMQGVV